MRRFSSFRDFDWTLLILVMLISVISVLEIKSATLHTKFHGFGEKQIELSPGRHRADVPHLGHRLPPPGRHRALGLRHRPPLAGRRKLVGTKVMGARRWINLGGGIHFQPSEWVKLILILAVARYFWGLAGRELSWLDIGKAFALVCVPMGWCSSSPTSAPRSPTSPSSSPVCFSAESGPDRSPSCCSAFAILIGGALISGKRLKPYQQARLTSFINPDTDPKGSGYQIRQSLIAVGSGGLWGKGTNKGTQTQGDFLPIPYTDFIFAAFCEEHGFVGGMGILLLYFLILTRLIQNAQQASDMPGTFIIMGVVAVILFQIVVNIGMVVGLMPVTGIPLPLMSYGGSSILFTFLALGIVMNIRMRRFVN